MRLVKQILPLGIASVLLAATPLQAAAASPGFSRTEEEWARLQDDLIEYGELAGLIHEYNATVQKNSIDYNEFKKEYGDTNEKVAHRYRELADELEANLNYPDSGDDGYGMAMASIISSESTIDNLRKQADEAVDDSTVQYLTYSQAEASLVSVAQTNMITYYQSQLQLQLDQLNRDQLQDSYQSAVNKRASGVATDVDVLVAQESVRTADQAIQADESEIEHVRQKLFVMLGWKYDANPQIGALPDVDLNRIAAMNPSADKQQALDNSYSLKINRRKLENAKSDDVKESLEKTIRESEQNIGAAVTANYQNVQASKTAYDVAVAQAALEQQNLKSAELKAGVGNMSQADLRSQRNKTQTAQLKVETAKLNLLQAVETYEWGLNGLAATS